jgi:hypothetical protein
LGSQSVEYNRLNVTARGSMKHSPDLLLTQDAAPS